MVEKKSEASLFSVEEYKANFKKNKKAKKEEKIQLAFCDYIKKHYPDIIFSCDLASGLFLPLHIGAMHKRMRSSRGHCDFFAAETIYDGDLVYSGFFLELKRDYDEVYTKYGLFKKKMVKIKKKGIIVGEFDHIGEQWDMIQKLRLKGYYADFGLGFDDCVEKWEKYLSMRVK